MAQYIYGRNTALQRLAKGNDVEGVYIQEQTKQPEILALAKQHNLPVLFKSKQALNKMVEGNHQGVVIQVKEYRTYSLDEVMNRIGAKQYPLLVLCDQLEDPHNLGAILRTCDGVGADGVIIGKHRSVSLTGTVAKVSTGAIDTVPVIMVTNLVSTIKILKEKGFWIIGTDNSAKAINYSDLRADSPLVLVVGSEGNGISRLVKESCDIMVRIPMAGAVTSLNVSVATGVILYDIHRKQSLLEK